MQDAHPNRPPAVAIVEAIEAALAGGPPVAIATVVTGGASGLDAGAKLLVRADGRTLGSLGTADADTAIREVAVAAFTAMPRIVTGTWYLSGSTATDRPSQAKEGAGEVMVQLFEAPARLVIVGAGHVGLALATFAELLGYETTVVDDREEFANRDRFPMAHRIIVDEVGPALDSLTLDASTAVVLVSRGHRVDEEALRHAVGRGAGYVGMIGSRRRTGTVLEHLAAEGYPAEALKAVATPVGLDIGAETPEEIAVSILAEMTMVRRGGSGARMSQIRASSGPT
ncbi:MAG: xanthine dehydrogenase [Dehalococcoidia bacterium]|nr:MAG: xanthine dehydrogenase [Dehalococcoidia bacterium]